MLQHWSKRPPSKAAKGQRDHTVEAACYNTVSTSVTLQKKDVYIWLDWYSDLQDICPATRKI
jgi:hypothetical protein